MHSWILSLVFVRFLSFTLFTVSSYCCRGPALMMWLQAPV